MYCNVPYSTHEWLAIAKRFEDRWNYPHALGAIDSKHIVIQKPANSSLCYFNYKHTHSILLLAVAGPNYECLYADIGANGQYNDGGIWSQSGLRAKLQEEENVLSIPLFSRYENALYFPWRQCFCSQSLYDEAIPSTRFNCRKTYLQLSP